MGSLDEFRAARGPDNEFTSMEMAMVIDRGWSNRPSRSSVGRTGKEIGGITDTFTSPFYNFLEAF